MNNPLSLEGKNIVITGASSGIGAETALLCSEMGANVVMIARDEGRLNGILAKMKQGKHLYYSLDITSYAMISSVIEDCVSKIGKIDGFIHSAGIENTIPINVIKQENYESTFSINLFSGLEFVKVLSKKKYRSEGLSIVFLASVMGVLGQKGKTAYCASKGAIVNSVKALSLELAEKNIRVNCISPAVVVTEMTKKLFATLTEEGVNSIKKMHPLGLGRPQDIANAAVFLLSEASRWVTGSNLIIDGGYSAQ